MSANRAVGEDWSQFRGPNGQGQGQHQATVPSDFGPDKNVLWKTPLIRGLSSPCVRGDLIFLTAFDAEQARLQFICIERNKGKIVWQREVAAKKIEKVHKSSSPANATAVADDQHVYVYFASCGIFCFDYQGTEVWHHAMPCSRRFNGSGTSPILAGDRLILNREDDQGNYLLALNAKMGDTAWQVKLLRGSGFGEATPVVWKDQLVLHRNNEVSAYALADGKRNWGVPLRTTAASTPAIDGDMLYVAAWNNSGEPDLKGKLPPFAGVVEKSDKDGDGALSRSEMPRRPALIAWPESGCLKSSFRMWLVEQEGHWTPRQCHSTVRPERATTTAIQGEIKGNCCRQDDCSNGVHRLVLHAHSRCDRTMSIDRLSKKRSFFAERHNGSGVEQMVRTQVPNDCPSFLKLTNPRS